MIDLSIIIVNWNVRDLLVECLRSIFKKTAEIDFEVIVVDNASNDSSGAAIRQAFNAEILAGKLLLIENKKNQGFSRANNQGFKEAKGRYLLFMNPDMEFSENSGKIMVDYLDAEPAISLATGRLLYGDRTLQPNVKRFPELADQALILLKLHHFWPTKSLKKYLAKDFDYTKPAEVDAIMGAFTFIRRELMEQLGGWSEDFWLWWEDVDLCYRAKKSGAKIMYLPITSVVHYEGKSFAQVASVKKQKRFILGVLTYFKKYHSLTSYILLILIAPVSLALAYISEIFGIKPRPQSHL